MTKDFKDFLSKAIEVQEFLESKPELDARIVKIEGNYCLIVVPLTSSINE